MNHSTLSAWQTDKVYKAAMNKSGWPKRDSFLSIEGDERQFNCFLYCDEDWLEKIKKLQDTLLDKTDLTKVFVKQS